MLFKPLATIALMATVAAAKAAAQAPAGKAFDHVVIIYLENEDFNEAASDPGLQALAANGITLNNYHAVAHPSQPNYIAGIAGDDFGITDDNTHNFPASYSTIVDLLEAKQLSWKVYEENLPSVCFTGSSSKQLYYRKHNPFVSFASIYENSNRCQNVVPATQFAIDINNGYLPNYVYYTPNINNDGHNTNVAYASQWLTNFLTPLLQNPTFVNNTLVIVTFDEAEDYSDTTNHVFTFLLGDAVKNNMNTVDSTYLTHYTLLSSLESNWGLGNLGRNDVNQQLSNVFAFVAAQTGYQNVNVTNPPPLNQ